MSRWIITGIVIAILIAVVSVQSWRLMKLKEDDAEAHRQLTDLMNEGYALRGALKDMTLEAHPYIKTGEVGPTASLELQCMQFKGLLPKPPSDDYVDPTK